MSKRLATCLEPFRYGLNATLRASLTSSTCHSLDLFERSRLFIVEHNQSHLDVRQYATLPSQHGWVLRQLLGITFVTLDVVLRCRAGRPLCGCTLKRHLGARDN